MTLDRPALRLLVAQAADVATFVAFYVLIGPGEHQERNPLILAAMALGGLAGVALLKLGITFAVIRRYRRPLPELRHRWYLPLRTVVISAAAASGIAGAGFNLAAILRTVAS